jgi:HSP20 family protein
MSQTLPERRSTTSPERWEPLGELEQATQRMRRMLDQTFGGFGWPSPLISEAGGWSPLVDIEEQDDAYVLEAELPGVKREDVDIEVAGNELSITGEIKEKERKGAMRRRTRRTGRFEYRVRLLDQVDSSKIEASLDQGVLTVRVPKSERAQRQKIEIKSKK